MDNNEKILKEQEAPLKNHDDAFVQVGQNGEPVIPQDKNEKEAQPRESDRITTLDKR
jgi:hypothetical protein